MVAKSRRTYRLLPSGVERAWRRETLSALRNTGSGRIANFNEPLHHRSMSGAHVGCESGFVRNLYHHGIPPLTAKHGTIRPPGSHREIMVESRVLANQRNADSLAWRSMNRGIRRYSIPDIEGHLAGDNYDFSRFGRASNKRQKRCEPSQDEDYDNRHHHTRSNSHRFLSIGPRESHPINMPVAYITMNPVKRPASIGPRAMKFTIGSSPAICFAIWTTTWAIAPTPRARHRSAHTG